MNKLFFYQIITYYTNLNLGDKNPCHAARTKDVRRGSKTLPAREQYILLPSFSSCYHVLSFEEEKFAF